MAAIKTISLITDNTLTLYGLEAFKGKTVEIIIQPVAESKKIQNKPDKKKLRRFRGVADSGYAHTSRNVDQVLYGK